MSDLADIANEIAEDAVARALASRQKQSFIPGPLDCIECGDPIRQARREAIPGTEHCSECAQFLEEHQRFLNGGKL